MFQNFKELRTIIQSKIIDSYDSFLNRNLNYVNDNFNSYRRVSFEEICSFKVPPFGLDFDSCNNFILDSRRDIGNTIFAIKKPNEHFRWDNEIMFPFIHEIPRITEWGTPEFFAYRKWRDDLEYTCESEFWKISANQTKYSKFASLNIFDNIVFAGEKLSFYENRRNNQFCSEIWLDYITSLVGVFFPKFIYRSDLSNKTIKRYLIELKNGILFGFEFNQKVIQSQLKKGDIALPQYFNLILVSEPFDKNEDPRGYYFEDNPSILSIGVCGNPYFYPPCYPLLGFSVIDFYKRAEEGHSLREIIKLKTGEYQIIHSAEYGESIKKHAFFYMDLLASTASLYTDFLEEVIIDIIE